MTLIKIEMDMVTRDVCPAEVLKRDAIYATLCGIVMSSKMCLSDPKSLVQYTNDVLFDLSDSIEFPSIFLNFRKKLDSKMK
jgi:hypothetical protein